MAEFIASAPGKILWIGGYSVLERPNVSFVTGVDKRVYARAREAEGFGLSSRQYNYSISGHFDSNARKLVLGKEDERAKFVKTAVESTLAYLAHRGVAIKKFELETHSDPAFGVETKAGLGGSAAVTVAAVAAVLGLHGVDPEKNRDVVHKLSQYSHSIAQGKVGSGFDVAAATIGAGEYVRYSPEHVEAKLFPQNIGEEWDHRIREVRVPGKFRVAIASLGKGVSTTEMVKKVNAWKAGNPEEYKRLLKAYDESNAQAIKALERLSTEFSEENLGEFKKRFEEARAYKRALGEKSGAPIEPGEYSRLIEESMDNGAFVAILPGAGGGDSIAAFCLSDADKARLETFWKSKGYAALPLGVSNEGVRVEKRFPA
jgi:phosphomevalonate kinase